MAYTSLSNICFLRGSWFDLLTVIRLGFLRVVFSEIFHQKLGLIQYNACLALTVTIRGISKDKPYEELGLEYLQHCLLYKKSYFYKFYKN